MHFLDRIGEAGGGGVGGLVSEFWGMCFLHKTPS